MQSQEFGGARAHKRASSGSFLRVSIGPEDSSSPPPILALAAPPRRAASRCRRCGAAGKHTDGPSARRAATRRAAHAGATATVFSSIAISRCGEEAVRRGVVGVAAAIGTPDAMRWSSSAAALPRAAVQLLRGAAVLRDTRS